MQQAWSGMTLVPHLLSGRATVAFASHWRGCIPSPSLNKERMALPAVDIHGCSPPLLLVLAEYVAVLRVKCKLWTYAAEIVHACVCWPACVLLLCTSKHFSYLQWKRAAQPSGRPLQTTDIRCSLLCFVLNVNCTQVLHTLTAMPHSTFFGSSLTAYRQACTVSSCTHT